MNLSTIYNFAFICVPKTASTSISRSLVDHCTINYGWKHSLKHMRAQVLHDHVMPFHQNLYPEVNIETFCIIRDPVDWVYSWYKFRSRDDLRKLSEKTNYTHKAAMCCGGISFESFVSEVLKGTDAAKFAKIGSQKKYILLNNGKLGIDKLFLFENGMAPVEEFLSQKIGIDFKVPHFNESPLLKTGINISTELRLRLEQHFRDDYLLYNGKYERPS